MRNHIRLLSLLISLPLIASAQDFSPGRPAISQQAFLRTAAGLSTGASSSASGAAAPAKLSCEPKAVGPINDDEKDVLLASSALTVDAVLCSAAGDEGCEDRAKELKKFQRAVQQLQAAQNNCAVNGATDTGGPLSDDQIALWTDHAKAWGDQFAEMSAQADAVKAGTYKMSDSQQKAIALLGRLPAPIKPVLTSPIDGGSSQVEVKGQPTNGSFRSSFVTLCSAKREPDQSSLDCHDPGKPSDPLTASPHTIKLATSLKPDQYVWVVQVTTNTAGKVEVKISEVVQVGPARPGCVATVGHPYRDCIKLLTFIGGVEQAGLASQPSDTQGFLRMFVREPLFSKRTFAWGTIRLLSAPQQSSTLGIVSAFSDPAGKLVTYDFSNVGQALDFVAGGEWKLPRTERNGVSLSFVAGGGFTTPLSTDSITEAFVSPALGTVECQTLWTKFTSDVDSAAYFPKYKIMLNDPSADIGTTTGSCLLNGNSPHLDKSGTTPVTRYDPITTVAFKNQDRSTFFPKAYMGLRIINRYLPANTKFCGNTDGTTCHYGIVDFLVGKDASINGGNLKDWLFKVDATQPLPIKGTAFLYLFGSFTTKVHGKTIYYAPLQLKPGDTTSLASTGSNPLPNINSVVLPLQQPDRDFYRFGVGIDVKCIFSKIFSSNSDCLASDPKQ